MRRIAAVGNRRRCDWKEPLRTARAGTAITSFHGGILRFLFLVSVVRLTVPKVAVSYGQRLILALGCPLLYSGAALHGSRCYPKPLMRVSRKRPPDPGETVIKKYVKFEPETPPQTSLRRFVSVSSPSVAWPTIMQPSAAALSCVFSSFSTPYFLLVLALLALMPGVSTSSMMGTRHVDLIESLQLWNTTYSGLTVIPGPRAIAPAIFLQGDNRDVRLPAVFQAATEALLSGTTEFTFMATIQQEEKNAGTILAFSKGPQRYLELQSSGRKDEVRLHYIHNGIVHIETFPFKLADQRWHKISVIVSGSQVELWVDCIKISRRLAPPPVTNFTLLSSMDPPIDPSDQPSMQASKPSLRAHSMALFLGQRNPGHFLFKGALQDVRVEEGATGHLLQCPQAEAQCPTCGGFQKLTEQVALLQDLVYQLTQKITFTEERLASIEECDCQKSCRVNGTVRQDGASWKSGCEICSCRHGEVTCRPVPCPNLTCKNPVYTEGECCPLCLKQCSLKGVVYDHGETVSPRQCVDCECRDGKMQCRRIDPEDTCPELSCPPSDQFTVPGQCCKFCPGIDYCSKGHSCHDNATCINLQTTYTCHCNKGFTGDGQSCQDIDECKTVGAHHGHYCQAHTTCINLVGSYECICDKGYIKQDEFTCKEHDECKAEQHQCPENSQCINIAGSYKCECLPGFEKSEDNCKPVCNGTCLNGGLCVSPDFCLCRLGFHGNNCELDIDECALELHHCPKNSDCINLPGWYSCQCSAGFTSLSPQGATIEVCRDIDECQLGTHTCSSTAKCLNTEGSFECICNNTLSNCSMSCVTEDKEHQHGDSWAPQGSKCSQCLCSNGKVTCDKYKCDCSNKNSHSDCCPECDSQWSCHPNKNKEEISYVSGQTWIDQCQICECLHGEIDCWSLKCPPVNCLRAIRTPGDCCPRCLDDPCSSFNSTVKSLNSSLKTQPRELQPCHHFVLQSSESSSLVRGYSGQKCQMPYCSELIGRKGAGTVLRANCYLVIPMVLLACTFMHFSQVINALNEYCFGFKKVTISVANSKCHSMPRNISDISQQNREGDIIFIQDTSETLNRKSSSKRTSIWSKIDPLVIFEVESSTVVCKNIKFNLQKTSSGWKRKCHSPKSKRLKRSFLDELVLFLDIRQIRWKFHRFFTQITKL